MNRVNFFLFPGCRMVKPILPREIAHIFPLDVVRVIYSYVPHSPKVSPTSSPYSAPSFEKELFRLQSKALKGKSAMYLKDFDDFLLDRYDCY